MGEKSCSAKLSASAFHRTPISLGCQNTKSSEEPYPIVTRQVGDKITSEMRYYLLRLPLDAQRFAEAVRGHWGIENQLHWILDVGFREDNSRAAQGYSAENLAVIRHLAVNLLTQEKTVKGGTRTKRLRAGWDDHYLTKVLAQSPQPPSKPTRKL
jgi:predicted transposase YbfD/YdcC